MAKIKLKGPVVTRESAWLYKWLGIDCISPADTEKALAEADGEDMEIEIASNGGYVTAAIDIYQMLRDYNGKVTARINYACSAATVIACAADESTISEAGFFMIHNAQSHAEGDKNDMQKEGEVLNTIDQGIINAYERKTGMSREEIQKLMSADTYMSAQDAIEKGFVDGLTASTDNTDELTTEEIVRNAAAGVGDLISEDKAITVMKAIKLMTNEQQISGNNAGSDITTQKGGNTMGLNEILAEHPEISNEIDERIAEARAEGVNEGIAQERARMQSLDDISACVTPEMLNEAKYGESPMNGQELAFKAMKENKAQGANYLAAASDDAEESGADEIGMMEPDVGEENTEEAEAENLANFVNKERGGK